MKRRDFVFATGALGLSFFSFETQGQNTPRFADMHAHLGRRQGISREQLTRHRIAVVAEKVIPDTSLIRMLGNRYGVDRDARPGEMRRSFEVQFQLRRGALEDQALPRIDSLAAFDKALQEGVPAVVLSSEGADFLEGDLGYLERVRAAGLVHLQLVHYRISDVGDISTEEPKHGGLTAFGKDVVRACNRLGILVDVAHCTTAGIEQAIELSAKPIVYSHGHVRAKPPAAALGGVAARAIHLPLAKRMADKGGVVGIWPLGSMYATREAYADALLRTADAVGPTHVGIGSDLNGLPSTVLPTHEEFAELAEILARRGLSGAQLEGIMGANYVRVLREAMKT
jgi:membrane dipeptidase